MKKLLIPLILLSSCTKQTDYSYLNTDRRDCKQVILVSERYTDSWEYIKTVTLNRGEHCDTDLDAYRKLKPDTLISSCSIDKVDSTFKIEIRTYKIQ